MDYSVAVVPVTKTDKSIDLFDRNYQPLNDQDRKNWEACKSLGTSFGSQLLAYFQLIRAQDDPETYDGAPVGLQIVARKHEEEKVWAMARIVDAALNSK